MHKISLKLALQLSLIQLITINVFQWLALFNHNEPSEKRLPAQKNDKVHTHCSLNIDIFYSVFKNNVLTINGISQVNNSDSISEVRTEAAVCALPF